MRALVLLLLVPTAAAAGFTLGSERTIEATVEPDGLALFRMPIHIDADGSLYAKMLATPDNAAAHEPGWNVSYRLDDSTLHEATPVPVSAGDDLVFEAQVRPPDDHHSDAFVYVALAYRPPASGSGGGSSGGTQDEARALTLIVHPSDPGEGEVTPSPTGPTTPPATPLVTPTRAATPRPVATLSEGGESSDTPLPASVLAGAVALALAVRSRLRPR